MRLFIAEKPELAQAIADGLGGGKKNEKDGYHDCGDDCVTWCFGHMLRLCEPHEYDKKYAEWNLADVPFSFIPWRKAPNDKCDEDDERSKKFVEHRLKQLDNVLALIKKADSFVHAGDPDAEGQLLIDEILQYAENKKPVKRVLINDNTPALVKKSLANLRDNAEFAGMSAAALARQVGDQFYGFNLSRLYTLTAKQAGYAGGTLSVGRVQTPILGLVVRRDRENAAHKLAFYYTVAGNFTVDNLAFPATYQVADNDAKDEKGRLTDEAQANAIAAEVSGASAQIRETKTAEKQKPAALPYNLLKLQTDAARLYKMKPREVKSITQDLREKHHLITYNRSDCQYLSEEQHADAPEVLAAISATNPDLAGAVAGADAKIKGRVFDSAKITAHHAIIPTISTANFNNLSTDEQKIYALIARAYVAQFYPPYRYEQTTVELDVGDRNFRCVTHVPVAAGWKSLFTETDSDAKEKDDEANDDGDCNLSLKELRDGQAGQCISAAATKSETQPKRLYAMATLLTDLTKVAQYIKDERIRKLLIQHFAR
ncbi:hypothetical protein FACS1894139_04510 [Planctomycetales bacterium]|nr:hypothetical protein FACS1894107_09210 [Planctomycetales bacterium]GHS99072.1 hypothetical protein FACS1894108_08390 [Planctomycetales bacterium]GHT03670.1 hypothetical protein FACS1894139_04510 [Planctomycetales bacterium]